MNNVVALGGTNLNSRQIELIQSKSVNKLIICLDQDNAGKEVTRKIKDVVSKSHSNIELKEITLPKGVKDPNQLLREQGVETLKTLIINAPPIQLNNTIQSKQASNKPNVTSGNKKAIKLELGG